MMSPSAAGPLTLSIVIVSYNARACLVDCLASIARHPASVPLETLVVDNASSDGSADVVEAQFPAARVIRNPRNAGFAAANNVGIRASRGELVLLLNNDAAVSAGALDRLIEALAADPGAAIAAPRLIDPGGRTEISTGRRLGPFTELGRKVFGRLYERGVPGTSWLVGRRFGRVHTPDWASGACLLVRRADAEAVGLFDERYFMYLEDVDFCAALRARGRRVRFVPGAVVTHRRGGSASSAADTALAHRRSHLAFYEKHHPHWVPWLRGYLRVTRRATARIDAGEGR